MNSNPNAWMAEKVYGYTTSGLFGYSHMTGGYAGGQAQYARVPFAHVGPLKIPDGLADDGVRDVPRSQGSVHQGRAEASRRDGPLTVRMSDCGLRTIADFSALPQSGD